jgi:hypothetical protein
LAPDEDTLYLSGQEPAQYFTIFLIKSKQAPPSLQLQSFNRIARPSTASNSQFLSFPLKHELQLWVGLRIRDDQLIGDRINQRQHPRDQQYANVDELSPSA